MLVPPFQHEELPAHDPKLLFGYPTAQESEAEGAALTIPRALADINAEKRPFGCARAFRAHRIACGSVVVDATGNASAKRRTLCRNSARTSISII